MKIKINRLFAGLLAIIMILSMLPLSVLAAEEDLTITTFEELKEFADSVNGGNTYEGKLIRLNVNVFLGGENSPWTPIGTSKNPFKGTFDGDHHVISGLYIASGSNVGFFGYVNGGTVKNLIVDGTVSGSSNTAGVVGYLTAGTVQNAGNKATVSGGSGVGGVVGYAGGAYTVSGCYNAGNITGTTGYVGGVAGWTYGSGTIENCYNIGAVKGPATVGGIAGGYKGGSTKVTGCYNAGKVSDSAGNSNNIGAIIGVTRGTVSNCQYLKNSGPNNYNYTEAATATDFDINALGSSFTAGNPYPMLVWEGSVSTDAPVRPAFDEKTELAAKLAEYIKAAQNSSKAHFGLSSSDSLLGNSDYMAGASSTETDWMAFTMGRFGYFDQNGNYSYRIDDGEGYSDYLAAMKAYIEQTYEAQGGILHRAKATEWHRAVVTIAALGGDPTNFGMYNGQPIDLIADGSYNNVLRNGPGTQGINGWIWGLIALDTGFYTVPDDAKYSRETFITEILKMQLNDGANGNEYGGWVLGGYGSRSDVDITSMTIQALAPYYNDDTVYTYTNKSSGKEVSKTVRQCIDEALDRLGSMMDENGSFSSWSTNNVEGVSQVVVALCSLGIDPARDTRFITASGKTLLDGILAFRLSDGGFCHILGSGWNSMATDQATYALVSYWRFESGMRALYDMRSDWTKEDRDAIDTAVQTIDDLPEPTSGDYKASLKSALAKFRAVPVSERRYVYNYSQLAAAIELVGGEETLDSDTPYVISISVTKEPDKVRYFEGESFDPTGMTVTALFSDGSEKEITDYKCSVSDTLTLDDNAVYIIYGILKTSVNITVSEKMPWEGEGTEDNPYLIENADDLVALAERVNAGKSSFGMTFVLTSHIDLSGIDNWTPIGKSRNNAFDGTFDGQGYAIDNLYFTSGGLFGYVGANAVIRNVGVASGEIGSKNNNVSFLGGIAGWSDGADFINCWNGADIYSGGYSGGIVGTVRNGGESLIKGCYNVGSIYGSTGLGGIVGHLDTTRAQSGTAVNVTVEDCYNAGTVSGTNSIGGIVGFMQDGHTVRSCYNIGETTGELENQVGAIGGSVTSGNIFENCYYNNEVFSSGLGRGTESDEVIGRTAGEMKSNEFIALLGEAFKEDTFGLVNNGYPLLYWQRTYDADDLNYVIEKINEIGTVDLDSEEAIKEARNAYDNLDDDLKQYVSNYDVLEQAEKDWAALITLEQAKETAKKELEAYKDLSDYRAEQQNELKQIIGEGKIAIDSSADIDSVNKALAEAKAKMDAVKTDKQLSDEEAAKKVSGQIAEIGTVTLESEDTILAARSVYDALSDEAKALVDNYSVLTDAEAELERLKGEAGIGNPDDGNVPSDENNPSGNKPSDYNTSDNNSTGNGSDNDSASSPQTGDTSNLLLYINLMAVSLIGLAVLTSLRKKQCKKA